ncbi:MAG TPA: hypothetical protein ENK25_02245 [Bacteroidetes bacterium]|nr:hypothetical protein [Bacteroidota bacterium]
MKNIHLILLLLVITIISCEPTFNDRPSVPDSPLILTIVIGNENGEMGVINAIDTVSYIDTLFVKDKTFDFSHMYINVSMEKGCKIEPLEGAPPCGTFGDYSTPRKYKVTAPSGRSATWTIVMAYYVEPIGCLADRWSGELDCQDLVWGSYAPTYCTGEKIDDDCSLLKVTFDFWGYGEATEVVLKFKLETIDMESLVGDLTLLEDASVTAEGYDITFHAGPAGTYSAASDALNIEVAWSGYDDSPTYSFKITPKE